MPEHEATGNNAGKKNNGCARDEPWQMEAWGRRDSLRGFGSALSDLDSCIRNVVKAEVRVFPKASMQQ